MQLLTFSFLRIFHFEIQSQEKVHERKEKMLKEFQK